MASPGFEQEHQTAEWREVRPGGRPFAMWVAPGHVDSYWRGYQPFSSDLLLNLLDGCDLFVDFGADYGYYSLLAASRQPALRVLAVEPSPRRREALIRNLRRNAAEGVQVVAAAGRLDELLASRPEGRLLLRLGVEGHEMAAIAGLSGALDAGRELAMLVELSPAAAQASGQDPAELLALLGRLGFEVHALREAERQAWRVRDPRQWRQLVAGQFQTNLYCQPRRRALAVTLVSHSADLNGAERSLLSTAEHLVRDHGALVTALLPSAGPLADRLRACGAATVTVDLDWWCSPSQQPAQRQQERLSRSLRALLLGALPALARFAPDAVFSNTVVQPWGAVLAALLGVPLITRLSELGERDHRLQFYFSLPQSVAELARASAWLFASSDLVRRTLVPGCQRCEVVPPPIDLPARIPASTPTVAAPFRIGVFSRVTPEKGQEDAVRALGELHRRGQAADLVLAGGADAPYLAFLRELAHALGVESRVRFTGMLADPIPEMLGCDVVLVCSRLEAFGRSAVEALLLGRPLVCTGTGGLAEITSDGHNAVWYPAGDALALANCLAEQMRDPPAAGRRALAAQREAGIRYSGTATVERYAAALRKVRGRPGPAVLPLLAPTLAAVAAELGARESILQSTVAGAVWRILLAYYRLVDRFLPAGSARRRLLAALAGSVTSSPRQRE